MAEDKADGRPKTPTWAKRKAEDDARRRRNMHAVAASLPKITGRAFGRRGLSAGGLIARWDEIVGSQLAEVCLPRRLIYPKRDARTDGVLTLRVASGHALSIQHMEPMILDRINRHMGYAAVTRLRLEQGPLTSRPGTASPFSLSKAPPKPDPERLAALDSKAAEIEDEELAAAFRRLGRRLAEDG